MTDDLTTKTGLTAAQRRLRAQLAAAERWSREPDRAKATRAAAEGFTAKLEREVDPEGILSLTERAVRVESARRAHMLRMALASSKARSGRKRSAI